MRAQGKVHWLSLFLSKLTDTVKLVGSTIHCQPTPYMSEETGDFDIRSNPHVQSYAMATDRIGLQVLMESPKIFACHAEIWDTMYHAEVGSSRAILKAGYNLDSLLVRYQGVDWRKTETWNCNRNMDPLMPRAFDGGSPEAMEVMFVKIREFQDSLQYKVASTEAAQNYDRWYRTRLKVRSFAYPV